MESQSSSKRYRKVPNVHARCECAQRSRRGQMCPKLEKKGENRRSLEIEIDSQVESGGYLSHCYLFSAMPIYYGLYRA